LTFGHADWTSPPNSAAGRGRRGPSTANPAAAETRDQTKRAAPPPRRESPPPVARRPCLQRARAAEGTLETTHPPWPRPHRAPLLRVLRRSIRRGEEFNINFKRNFARAQRSGCTHRMGRPTSDSSTRSVQLNDCIGVSGMLVASAEEIRQMPLTCAGVVPQQ